MKFGKQILAQQIPGWSQYYLDYKFLKKIVSSLSKSKPVPEATSFTVDIPPGDFIGSASSHLSRTQPPLWPSSEVATPRSLSTGHPPLLPLSPTNDDDERGSAFQARKAHFFFKLERELEKINTFYLQKEAELKLRLETLLSKRKAAASRFLPDGADDMAAKDHVEWKAVEEGFRLLERDLGKLQQFVDINAIGFRKILKKWDKRAKSSTKELYLARQVEVQPVFNRQLLSDLSNTVTDCLVDVTNVSMDPVFDGPAATDMIFSHQITLERTAHMSAFNDLESNLRKAVSLVDEGAVRDLVRHARNLLGQEGTPTLVNRILWKAAIEAPPVLADIVMTSPNTPFDFRFIDDINGRTCLHEAAIAGAVRLVELCLSKDVQVERVDVYGRSALHYGSMNGHANVCRRLLKAGIPPDGMDMDNYSPLIHAIISGSVECVEVLLADSRVSVTPSAEAADLLPLSLACQFGRVEVAQLLTRHGAHSLPNTNGEYPMHLAAREGHAEVCKLLVNHEGSDVSDKYNEWTPLFHAATNGHKECLEILLGAGCKASTRDETGRLAVFYAAWNGHLGCVNALLVALACSPGANLTGTRSPVSISPLSDFDLSNEGDAEHIPSLSLPPPIIPFRVYGHNYLDKSTLVQVTLGHPLVKGGLNSDTSAIQLIPRIVGTTTFEYPHAAPSLKLVMTSLPDTSSAHHAISLPLKRKDSIQVFVFQLQSLADLSLEFSVYPSFGSKTLGRAVALPATFGDVAARAAYVLPVLDHRLHVIGQISFEVCIITPFHDVTLEIGGAVETYWKSMSMPPAGKVASRHRMSQRIISSTQTSPSIYSPALSAGTAGLTLSSLRGDYVHAVIQVTRDLVPIVFSRWNVPMDGAADLGVADLTLAQLLQIAEKEKIAYDTQARPLSTTLEWARTLSTRLIPLKELLQTLPLDFGVSLELAYPTPALCSLFSLGRSHGLNTFVDSILSTVYATQAGIGEHLGLGQESHRRKLLFSSFAPDVCAALNWKQPNYAVFFASDCGVWDWSSEGDFACSMQVDKSDKRCHSVAAAVEFAKANNLLGVLINACILAKVPSLIQGIKETGVLLATFAMRDMTDQPQNADTGIVDAVMRNGVLTFVDHSSRT